MNSRLTALRVAIAMVLMIAGGCDSIDASHTPSADDVRARKQLQPFIFDETELTGIYVNTDVDAVLFSYRTDLSESEFLHKLSQNVDAAGWRLATRNRVVVYERFTPRRGELGISGSEEARVTYAKGRVVVGWVQADHMGDPIPVSKSSEGQYAADEIWPRFEKACS